MKSHARQKSKNALKRRSNFNPPRFCISAPSGSRRRPRNRRSVARFFIARPAGTPLALKESAGCLEITFSRCLCQPRPDSTFFLIRGLQRAPIRRRLTGGWPQPPGQPPVCYIRRVSRRFGLPAICRRFGLPAIRRRFGLPAIRRRFAPADPDYVSLSSYRHSHVLSYLGLLFLGAL